MPTFYHEIREAATRLNLEISNHHSDLYVEDHPEIREAAVRYGKAKRNSVSNDQLSRGIHSTGYSGLSRFTCQITGKPMLKFPFAYLPYWVPTMKPSKYTYEKIIQQNAGQGWEDVSSYPATSQGLALDRETRELLQHDFREYARMGYPVRVIFRKTLNVLER